MQHKSGTDSPGPAESDLISAYLRYASESSEVPAIFHRWAIICGIGAMLGRRYYFRHGHSTILPNFYCMLMGSPGTRKSSAINISKRLLREAGYDKFSAEKTTKEKFLMDMAGESSPGADDFLEQEIFGESLGEDAEVYIAADEFNDFFGNNGIDFVALLGTLWDWSGKYENKIKNGQSVFINNPTISILGGNTPTGFALAFPAEVFGQGFFSRILLIHGDPSGRRIAFPDPPSDAVRAELVLQLQKIRAAVQGEAKLHPDAKVFLSHIYEKITHPVDDVRFATYSTRRFTHLLKLCLITSAARCSTTIELQDAVAAHTYLSYAESRMPQALGEFGKSKHSEVSHKIVQLTLSTDSVLSFQEIWKHVQSDLEKVSDLATVLQNLVTADKLQAVPGGAGYVAKRRIAQDFSSECFNVGLLTAEERASLI